MLAAKPEFNVEAAAQVAHAFTVHKAAVEDDYFSAVDDLNRGDEDKGSGHIGEAGFGAGVFYLYICINHDLLLKNLGGDKALADKTLTAMLHAVTKVSPTGKQNSFASRAYAGFVLAEQGEQQPRSLAQAFLAPVRGANLLVKAAEDMKKRRDNFEKVYGKCADRDYTLDGSRHRLAGWSCPLCHGVTRHGMSGHAPDGAPGFLGGAGGG
jgi:CRISPR system Cascade subunit CasC